MEENLQVDTSEKHLPPCREKPTYTVVCLAFLLMLVLWVVWLFYTLLTIDGSPRKKPELSGLGTGVPLLPRAFNLTLSIDNVGVDYEECVGGEAVVLYGGVPLATGVVREFCVPANGTGKVAVFAGSGGVGLPTELAELMADEKRGGAVQLVVRLFSLKYMLFFRCTASLRGGAADRLPPCKRMELRDESDGVEKMICYG